MRKDIPMACALVALLTLSARAGAADEESARIPSKWFSGVRGHAAALEAQKTTGADMVVLFYRDMPKDEKGLCHWFRQKTLDTWPVTRLLKDYVKVEVLLSANDRRAVPLIEEYKVGKTPRFVVRRPDGHRERVDCFDWPGGQPTPLSPEEFVRRVTACSSPPRAAAP